MPANTQLPDFDFAGRYYGEILEAELEWLRKNVPEINSHNPYEPGVQLARLAALVGHLNNTLLDSVANEAFLPTARLRDSVVRLLSLIGYIPGANVPASTYLRAQLTRSFSASTLVVSAGSLFGTRRNANLPAILFEADDDLTIERTDQLGGCHLFDYSAATWTDRTTEANTDSAAFDILPGADVGDSLYVMHANVMSNTLEFTGHATAPDFGDDRTASPRILVWEYHDGNIEDDSPDTVTNQGASLKLVIDGLLGTSDTRAGAYAWVTVNATGTQEELVIQHDGTNNYVVTSGFLGQTTPSTDPDDYTVGTYWHEIEVTDETRAVLPVSGEVAAVADGAATSFAGTLERYPLESATSVTFSYTVGGVAKTATIKADDTLSGDAGAGTSVNRATGVFALETQGVPDAGNVTVAYSREQQPFQRAGKVSFVVPKNDVDDWRRGTLSDALPAAWTGGSIPSDSGYWLRLRVVSLGDSPAATVPRYDRIKWDRGDLFVHIDVTQGRTHANEVLGSGDGTANQAVDAANSPVIEGSVSVTVDGTEWAQVNDFASSGPNDRHYIVRVDSDGVATITFGDGTNGLVPPTGTNNIRATYRVGGNEDGNVGANQIVVNRSGLSRVKNVTNPRAASGWEQQEGATDDTLAVLKRRGVASLRTLERAVSPADVETLTKAWRDAEGKRPFSRSHAIQNGYGLKTIKNVVVPKGGGTSSPTVRAALDAYFNGNRDDGGDEPGVLIANTRVTSVDYTPKVIDIEVEVDAGNKEAIETAIETFVHPEALLEDGATYRWNFGGKVTTSKLISAVLKADRRTDEVNLISPAEDQLLGATELPVLGSLIVRVTG